MSEKNARKERQIARRFLTGLISNFTFWDRIKFVFTGDYWKPLQRTYNHLNDLKQNRKI